MARLSLSKALLCSVLALGNATHSVIAQENAHAAPAPRHRVVFQVSDGEPGKWELTLNNVRNLQKEAGNEKANIEIVAYGPGVGMLKRDSKVAQKVQDALAAGVKIVACENTMNAMHLTKDDMLPNIGYVPSGVFEVMRKQEEGYAYIRP